MSASKTQAEQFSEKNHDDGQYYSDDFFEELEDTCKRKIKSDARDIAKYIFKDGSCIVVDCRSWDIGYTNSPDECLCMSDEGHHKSCEQCTVTLPDGYKCAAETAIYHMDDGLREELSTYWHGEDDKQAFLDKYCEAHREKFGEEFIVN